MVSVVQETMIGDVYVVLYSDGSQRWFDAVQLGCEWLTMDKAAFYRLYGFSFNPLKYEGLYERCRKRVQAHD